MSPGVIFCTALPRVRLRASRFLRRASRSAPLDEIQGNPARTKLPLNRTSGPRPRIHSLAQMEQSEIVAAWNLDAADEGGTLS